MSFEDYQAFINALLADQQITGFTDSRIEPPGPDTAITYPKIIVFPVTSVTSNLHARRHLANKQIQADIRSIDVEITEKIGDLVKYCLLHDNSVLNAAKIGNVCISSEVDIFQDPVFQKSIRISYSRIERVR